MTYIVEDKELNPIEQQLKSYYKKYPSRHFHLPCMQEQVQDILEASYANSQPFVSETLKPKIGEHTFISDDMDAAFVKHMRYTPAFWHEHDFFELLYVLNGQCTNTMFNQTISMKAGDICIIAPGVVHAISAFSDEDILLNILIRKSTFERSFLGLLEGDDILSDFFKRTFYQTVEIPYLLFHTGNDTQLHHYVNRAYTEYNSKNRYKKQMLNAILSEFFIALFRKHEQDIEVPNIRLNTAEENLMYILRYMQAHYTTITLKELSAFFNYSERHLQRIILKATGMTFKENIQKQKMTKAADLLLHSSLPISKICEQLGFQSFNNFRKIFYKHYQMTPTAYRNSNTAK
ncbi:MAG: AraC family transcriptional regulator [Eubacteriales bacterium]|nr:AraC family transcriptional regulator [Eubacteriales bacterium]